MAELRLQPLLAALAVVFGAQALLLLLTFEVGELLLGRATVEGLGAGLVRSTTRAGNPLDALATE